MTDLERALAAGGKVAAPAAGGTDLERALAAGGKPADVPPSAPEPEKPSFIGEATKRVGDYLSSFANPVRLADVGQSFKDFGHTVAAANDFAGRAIVHPVDTFGDGKAGAVVREGMRGVNSNIPLANLAVEHAGGPAETSPADAAAAPGAQQFGALAGTPIAGMEGELASRAVGAAAPALSSAAKGAGAAAEERGVGRALGKLEEKVTKKTRAGLATEPVEDIVRENPEIKKAAGNDAKLEPKVDALRSKAIGELDHIYSSAQPAVDHSVPIANMDKRIADLRTSKLPSAKKTADALQTIRDDLVSTLGDTPTTPKELRAIQSDYQKTAYGKAMPGDQAATVNIAAHEEAQKAVGDAVLEHVTGLDHKGALAAAEENPDGLAARLLKANKTVNGANRIAKGIDERAARVQPKPGIVGKAQALAHVVSHPASLIPGIAEAGVKAADAGITRIAPGTARAIDAAGSAAAPLARAAPVAAIARGPDAVLEQLLQRADAGDQSATMKLADLAKAPIVAARIDALRRRRAVVR